MKLEKKIISKLLKGSIVALIAKSVIGIAGGFIYNEFIRENLEHDAILCNPISNVMPLPLVTYLFSIKQNRDLNGNGKYESALFYESDDKIVYQKIIKGEKDKLVLEEPKNYEF